MPTLTLDRAAIDRTRMLTLSFSLSLFTLAEFKKTGAERLIVDAAVELAERGHDVRWRTERGKERASDFFSMFLNALPLSLSRR